jgi:hypothetical protein
MEHFDGVRGLGGYVEKHQIRRAFRKRSRECGATAESFTSDSESSASVKDLRDQRVGFDDERKRERGRFLPDNVGEAGWRARNPLLWSGFRSCRLRDSQVRREQGAQDGEIDRLGQVDDIEILMRGQRAGLFANRLARPADDDQQRVAVELGDFAKHQHAVLPVEQQIQDDAVERVALDLVIASSTVATVVTA